MEFQQRLALIAQAHREVQLATAQETEDGNPVVGAKYYATAIELVVTAVEGLQHPNTKAESYFLFQCRQKLEDYYARARLLLTIAEDEGLDINLEDCLPTAAPHAGLQQPMPPAPPVAAPVAYGYPQYPAPLGAPPAPVLGYPVPGPSIGYPLPSDVLGLPMPLGMQHQYPPASPPIGYPCGIPAAAAVQSRVYVDPVAPTSDEARKVDEVPVKLSVKDGGKETTLDLDLPQLPPVSFVSAASEPSEETSAGGSAVQPVVGGGGLPPMECMLSDPDATTNAAPAASPGDSTGDGVGSTVRRMFQDDDDMRPGNPHFDDLFRTFTFGADNESEGK